MRAYQWVEQKELQQAGCLVEQRAHLTAAAMALHWAAQKDER